jgi:hypothetical protein
MMNDFLGKWDDWADISESLYMTRLRNWRNDELVKTDWTQVADAPVDQAAWATYRQALRDLPASNVDPRQIEFPVAP